MIVVLSARESVTLRDRSDEGATDGEKPGDDLEAAAWRLA